MIKDNIFKSTKSNNSKKIILDKYYTPQTVVEKCINILENIVGDLNEYKFIEPSAGDGAFYFPLISKTKNVIAFDISPDNELINQQDFLELDTSQYTDYITIGNPPYGSRMNLAQKFYKKSIEYSSYIAFILPISQLNNTSSLYEFDLISSNDLGVVKFSGTHSVKCCFNVYKKPVNGLNVKNSKKLKDVEIVRNDSKRYDSFEYDLLMCNWGNGTAGKIVNNPYEYSGMYKIKIKNDNIKNDIIELFKNIKWEEEINISVMKSIKIHHIVDVLKKYIPNIK